MSDDSFGYLVCIYCNHLNTRTAEKCVECGHPWTETMRGPIVSYKNGGGPQCQVGGTAMRQVSENHCKTEET